MRLGYIHISKDEQSKVLRVLKLCSEPSALDELGIGRIRDAFSDMMFPGSSSLQKHAIYFSLLPQIYKAACKKKYNRIGEVKAEVIRLEKMVTRKLCASCPNVSGITGSDSINNKSSSYVKFDPAYIYNSGLLTYGILKNAAVEQSIFSSSKNLHNRIERIDNADFDDREGDAKENDGNYQFCAFPPNLDYDIEKDIITLTMSPADIEFVKGHMLKARICQGTILHYLLNHDQIELKDNFFEFDKTCLPSEMANIYDNAKTFANFIYIAQLRYNYILSKKTDDEMLKEFESELDDYHNNKHDIRAALNGIHLTNNSGIQFCLDVANYLDNKDMDGLDELIKRREMAVKGKRRKINTNYIYNPKAPLHHYKLNYRWPTVRALVHELRGEEVGNG